MKKVLGPKFVKKANMFVVTEIDDDKEQQYWFSKSNKDKAKAKVNENLF